MRGLNDELQSSTCCIILGVTPEGNNGLTPYLQMGDPHQKYNIDLIPVGCSNICVWGDLCVCCMIGVLLLLSAYNGIWSIPKVCSTSPNDQVDY